jgi:hypothetical protein
MAEYEQMMLDLMNPSGTSLFLPASDYTGQAQPLFWMNPTAPAVPGAPQENIRAEVQRELQDQAQQEVAKAGEEPGLLDDSQQIMGWLTQQHQAAAMSNLQKTLLGFAEGQLQSPYAGNRVFGASIAGAIGANQKDIERKLSLSSQLMSYAQELLDHKRKKLEIRAAEEAMKRAPEAEALRIRGLEANVKTAEYNLLQAPKVAKREEEAHDDRMQWNKLNQERVKLENDIKSHEFQINKELDPIRKKDLIIKLQYSQASLQKILKDLDYYDKKIKAELDYKNARAADAYHDASAPYRGSGGGGNKSTTKNSFRGIGGG